MVRDELGPDALILANRAVDGGVELTAAHEDPQPEATGPVFAASTDRQVGEAVASSDPASAGELTSAGALRWHGVPAAVAARLRSGDLATAVAAAFRFDTLPCRPDGPPLLIAGPPGAGKTFTTARLATRLKLSGHPAMVITCDSRRAGAAEQLAAFTRLLGLTLIVADNPQQLTRAIARRTAGQPVLIDMPGLNPAEKQDQTYLLECQSAVGGTVALVLPAGLDPAEAEDLGRDFKASGATLLIATRLDQSRRLGGLLAAADTGLAFTDAGIGAGVADGLVRITPGLLAERLCYARQTGASSLTEPAAPISPLALHARAPAGQPRPE
ncbi:MAG: GTP-binding protein [Acetobacteraceae bacterium]|nr:GTP-binding protein [Acetobacteraceae bacterium]